VLAVGLDIEEMSPEEKVGGIPRYASQKWINDGTIVMESETRCTIYSL
jgi:hypothetical protein